MKTKKEIINKLIEDTDDDIIKWTVEIENLFVRASFEQKFTPLKKIVYKIVYYTEHSKGTKLHITFIKKSEKGVNASMTLMDLGGSKKREEVRIISHLLNKILLKEEKNKQINIDLDDVFTVGDRVVVVREQDFPKDQIIGQKGTIIRELEKNKIMFLVKFDNEFNSALMNDDFDFSGKNISSGNCWLMDPNNLRKINDKKTNEKIVYQLKEFNYFQN